MNDEKNAEDATSEFDNTLVDWRQHHQLYEQRLVY